MKRLAAAALSVVLLLVLVPAAGAADPVVRMRFGHVAPPMHAQAKAADWFADYVNKQSNGRIVCSTHPQGQLGSHNQMLEALQVGTLEMTSVAGSAVADFVPEMGLVSFPFFFNTEEEMYKLMASPAGKKAAAAFGGKGLAYGGITDHGFKAFLNRVGPVAKIDDLKTYKWRVIPNELFMDTYKAMGANPVTLPWPEVFSALQRGVIDGIDITPNECWGAKIYEVIKYMSLCKLGVNPQVYVASKKWLEGLPADLRQIVVNGMAEASKWHTEQIRKEDASVVMPDLKAKGVVINEVSAEELGRFRKAVEPVHAKWREKIGPALYDEAKTFLEGLRK